ncbi:hypothetical protein Pfo_016296 [Paulownia fortunei]|nr:hypothetical protein Pfo_016296 [Paulownia fortunei]
MIDRMSVDHHNLDKNYIATLLVGIVRDDPMCQIKYVMQFVKQKLGFEISYSKAWYSLKRTRENVYGTWENSVQKLPKFMRALQKSNEGTVVEWDHKDTRNPRQKIIKYVFWAFKPCIEGFHHLYGSRDPSLLSMQSQHRSEIVMTGTIDEILHGRRADGPFWQLFDQVHSHARVLTILHHMGFYGVYRCGRFIADYHLITTLVERWRRKTHTFHFRVGEATITLQDVAVIWGLPIDGRPVTGVDHEMSIPQWVQYCEVTLGFHPAPEHFRGHVYIPPPSHNI